MTDDTLMILALGYAERGWAVFPCFEALPDGSCSCGNAGCTRIGKHPRTPNGLTDAKTNPISIQHWWTKWPSASIGIATGPASGLFVVDVDPRAGGNESLAALEATHGRIDPTIRVLTGGGGQHIYMRHAPGCRTTVGVLGPGIDTRGPGGYVIAPPSPHPSGKAYAWDCDYHPDDVPLSDPPTWVLAAVAPPPPPPPPTTEGPIDRPGVTGDLEETVGNKILTWAVGRVKRDGKTRNVTGFDLACQLRDNSFSLAQARVWMARFTQAVSQMGDHPYAPTEAEKSLRSAYARPPRSPWADSPVPIIGGDPVGLSSGGGAVTTASIAEHRANRLQAQASLRHLTDMGNAERLVDRYGSTIRYVYTWEQWMVWDGARWATDTTAEIVRLAKDTVRQIYSSIPQIHDQEHQKRVLKHAQVSESDGRIRALLHLAQSEAGIPLVPEQLDADPWLLNLLNGTLDLRTGELLPHDPERLCSKVLPVVYDAEATCPRWDAFLARVMGDDADMVAFLRRSAGYWLTGSTREQCLWILHGGGSNGKSTYLEILKAALGEYARQADPKTFTERKSDAISNDLAALKGARLVVASETDSGRRLAEGLVKQVTGGEAIVARFLHKEFFEFTPEFKLVLATNHKPVIKGTDHAIWRRIRLVPFEVTIPEAEKDKNLKDRILEEELAGILAWAVRGCLEWQRDGLKEPSKVSDATTEYRESMDSLGAFFEEACEFHASSSVSAKDLYAAYQAWCESSTEQPISKRTFGINLMDRGLKSFKGTGGVRRWIGIRVAQVAQVAQETTFSRSDFFYRGKTSEAAPLTPLAPLPDCPHESVRLDGQCVACGADL